MARIRTIKPEFPQSETVGKLSRDARLLFILLWTFVDDHGRSRGNSRLLASSLFPYDNDAISLIDGWLDELERLNCIRRYIVSGDTYLDIPNWSKHQRIDNAGKSRIPEFIVETPRNSAKISDPPLYLGPRTMDLGEDPPTEGPPDKQFEDAKLAVEIYNAVAGEVGWPLAQRLTAPRRSAISARLRECGGVDGWRAAIDKAKASAFLTGNNPKGWRADLDFFCQAKSFTKLMEGSYDDRSGTNGKPSAHDRMLRSIARVVEKRAGMGRGASGADAGQAVNGDGGTGFTPLDDDLDIPASLRRQ